MRINKFIMVTIFVILLFPIQIAFCASEDLHIEKGALAEKEGNFETAVIEYRKAIEANPKLISVYYSLGGIYQYKLKNYRASVEIYKKGLKHAPNDYGLNLNIMYAYFDLGDINNGIKHYKALSNILGTDRRYSFPRDSLQKITKDMTQEEIITFCREYLAINPTDNILREILSNAYMKECDYKSAKKEYEEMLKHGYKLGNIYFNLGICDYHLGFYKNAKRNLTKAKNLGEYVPAQYFDMVDQKITENGASVKDN